MSNLSYTYYEGAPRWPDHPDSVLFHSIQNIYLELYDDKLPAAIVHHETECGWLAKKNPKLQMLSVGTRVEDADTSDETLVLDMITRPAIVILTFLERAGQSIPAASE
jgi:di/tripeptidase